jgi:hypothetical protein
MMKEIKLLTPLRAFQVPQRGETPTEEVIDFLHEATDDGDEITWSGDDEGIVFEFTDGRVATVFPGDWVYRDPSTGILCTITAARFAEHFEELP